MTIAPTPTSTARSISARLLLLPWKPEARGVDAGGERDGELAAAAHVDVEAGVGHPARDLGAQERLAGVVDLRARADRARTRRRTRLGCSAAREQGVGLVDDVQRGAELARERGRRRRPPMVRSHRMPRGPRSAARPARRARWHRRGWREPLRGERVGGHDRPHGVVGIESEASEPGLVPEAGTQFIANRRGLSSGIRSAHGLIESAALGSAGQGRPMPRSAVKTSDGVVLIVSASAAAVAE